MLAPIQMLRAALDDSVSYTWALGDMQIPISKQIGREISIRFCHEIRCCSCGQKTKKSFMNGFCFPCFQSSPESSPCILRPELCRAHLGEGRDVDWEECNHNQPHVVYLAFTSGFKVGVTRACNVPSRWLDQGAIAATILAETPNRFLAGCIEVALKSIVSDKTSWQAMLKQHSSTSIVFDDIKAKAHEAIPPELSHYLSPFQKTHYISYPVPEYPDKIKSLTLDKAPLISGTLTGIKGQYFYLDNTHVFNVRRHTGYLVEVEH